MTAAVHPHRGGRGHSIVHVWLRRVLGLPLETKLLGANLLVIAISLSAYALGVNHRESGLARSWSIVIAALVAGWVTSFVLVRLALQPVKAMQLVAEQIAKGKLAARVQPSVLADTGLVQLATTFNEALAYLSDAREHMRKRGANVVHAQERERASIARELQESIGQTLAAAGYQAAAAARASRGQQAEPSALEAVSLIRTALNEIQAVSRHLYPRIADDLGLPAALQSLARITTERSLINVRLLVSGFNGSLSPSVVSTLYRITQDALSNIECNAATGSVTVTISSVNDYVQLKINDDCLPDIGKAQAALRQAGERIALLGGELLIQSNFQGGSRVIARLKLQAEAA